MQPNIQAFFDPVTWTVSYVVFDKPGGHCAIIDPVLDYDPKSGRTKHHSADVLIKFVHSKELTVDWILETHAHADHLSSAHYLQQELGGKVAIGSRISGVQQVFKKLFNMGPDFQPDGSQFDHLFDDGDTFEVGELKGRAILCLDIHRLIWPTSSGMRFLSAIRCSCRMWERPVLISLAGMPGSFIVPFVNCWISIRRKRGCSCVTTIRPAIARYSGRVQLLNNEHTTFMCTMVSTRTDSLRCAPRVMLLWKCRC